MRRSSFPSSPCLAIAKKRTIQRRLLKWFDGKPRQLPWLTPRSPYRVWVSEIMLQQTQIKTVLGYYRRFIKAFPSVKALANAELDTVLKQWEGLGYYRRAKQLHKAAQQIVANHNGKFPTKWEDVIALPGIGRYTAAAILSISLDQQHAILEGNTIRLFARLQGLLDDVTTTNSQKQLWQFSEELLPQSRTGDFNQALMDYGREVCTVKSPQCERCVVWEYCEAFRNQQQSKIPFKASKTQFEDLHEAIVLIQRNNKILVRKCQPDERWAGLWDFPRYTLAPGPAPESELAVQVASNTGLAINVESLQHVIKHSVTKYRIKLACFRATEVRGRLKPKNAFTWVTAAELSTLGLNASGRKFANKYL